MRSHTMLMSALLLSGCARTELAKTSALPALVPPAALQTFALGSCLGQNEDLAVLRTIEASQPQLLLMMGDNVYADASTPSELHEAYAVLGARTEFQSLAQSIPLLAVWDDHDYGTNDSGKDNPIGAQSKAKMLDFFGVPKDSPRRHREGNYDAVSIGPRGYEVQFILLDTRWFRDPLEEGSSTAATLLGPEQWRWLEDILEQPARLRFIVSSIQFIAAGHPYERWDNFPHERERLAQLLAQTKVEGVVILSGDRHQAELSCATVPGLGYPLFEFTASSFNRPNKMVDSNPWRVHGTGAIPAANYGAIDIDWTNAEITFTSFDPAGEPYWRYETPFPSATLPEPPEHCIGLQDHRP